jgi:hypothetical protein
MLYAHLFAYYRALVTDLVEGRFLHLTGVTRVLQGCYKYVKRVLQECYKGVTRVLQGCYKGVTRALVTDLVESRFLNLES